MECLSGGAIRGGESDRDEEKEVARWLPDERGWCRDVTSLHCNGKWIPISIVVRATNELVLSIDELPGEDAEQLKAWLEPILEGVCPMYW